MHHYNGIWGTCACAPERRNMHHQGAICTMVHKGDYIFLKIQGTLMIFCFSTRDPNMTDSYKYHIGSTTGACRVGSQVFEWVTLLQLFLGSQVFFYTYEKLVVQKVPSYHCE